jgi:hypothetical protein
MAKSDKSGKLFEYAVLYHPNATKDQIEAGETPKSIIIVQPTRVLAASAEHVAMLAARSLPEEYTDKLDDVEVLVRPF